VWRRSREAAIPWPLPEGLDEAALHAKLYRRAVPASRAPAPDFVKLQAELKRPGVTRALLWQEYKAAHPDGQCGGAVKIIACIKDPGVIKSA
jgi:transposase